MHGRALRPVALFSLLGVLGVLGCGHAETPEGGLSFAGVQCSAVQHKNELSLVGWDATSRANLARLRKEGVAAVRYVGEGCKVELELMSNCVGPGHYKYTSYAESQSKVMKSPRDLFSEVPVGAANLSGKLSGGKVLRADFDLVGTASLPTGTTFKRSDLRGPDCAKATHVVSTVYVGGFAMVAGAEAQVASKPKLFTESPDADAAIERIDTAGDAKACEEAKSNEKESSRCSVPLRLALMPISEDGRPSQGGSSDGGESIVGRWREEFPGRTCSDEINLTKNGSEYEAMSANCVDSKPYITGSTKFDGTTLRVEFYVPGGSVHIRYELKATEPGLLTGQVFVDGKPYPIRWVKQ